MKILDRADLEARGIKYSPSQLWRKERDGSFPRSVRFSGVRKGWAENEIDDWLAARLAERDETAA
jgi:prophage regulatory protein